MITRSKIEGNCSDKENPSNRDGEEALDFNTPQDMINFKINPYFKSLIKFT